MTIKGLDHWLTTPPDEYGESPQIDCACPSEDSERCVVIRYNIDVDAAEDIEPCECSCHDFNENDDGY